MSNFTVVCLNRVVAVRGKEAVAAGEAKGHEIPMSTNLVARQM